MLKPIRKNPVIPVLKHRCTLGPAYNEFGYYEHPATTSRLFSQKR